MFRTTSAFDKLLDKATSHLRLEPDWPTILQINDLIRQGDVQPKNVLASIKKKLTNPNPHVAMFALIVLESCVKNCGSLIHDEIGTKAYMEQLRELVRTTTHEDVKNKILELIQAWAFAFRNSPKYRAVQDTMTIMKAEEYKFPVLKESDAMFSADTAPEWADGECCHRCRVQFNMVLRKHHCRACGQVFCNQCSSKNCTLPKFGIEKEVRVCEACHSKLTKPTTHVPKSSGPEELPAEYLSSSLAQQNQAPPPRKSEDELREEEELQLALALSQSEAEQKNKQKSGRSCSPASKVKTQSPPTTRMSQAQEAESPLPMDVDPNLARYLNRSFWENRAEDVTKYNEDSASAVPSKDIRDNDMEEFVRDLKGQVEIFVNRMKSNSSRGRSIANDSSVQKLFMNITAMHSKLLHYIQQQDDIRVHYEGLQDKLVQVKDARAALDALREEHRERLRREAEIAERQRQHQMAQKLNIMRQKKQEYLQYQQQLTLQRIQDQEREMQLRQEHQKQQYLKGSQFSSLGYIPPGFENAPVSSYGVPPGFPQFPPGMPGMMMAPSGYIAAQPGAPPMMRPHVGQMLPPMGSLPPQSLGSMPPNNSPAHMPQAPAGAPGQFPGQIHAQQAHIPGYQIPAGSSQIPINQNQMPIPPSQGQIPPNQGQMPPMQGQMPPNQGIQPQPVIHNMPPSQTLGIRGQIPSGPALPHSGIHGQMPMSNHPTSSANVPNRGHPLSPPGGTMTHSNVPPPMGQPYPPQQAPTQEETAELISFD